LSPCPCGCSCVLSHVPRAIMHTSVVGVCVGRLSCWGGRSPRRAGGERGGILSLHFLAFFPDPTPPLTPLVRAPRPRYLCFTSRVLFPVPAPCDACVVSCAHVVFASACVFDFGVCVCVGCADMKNKKTIATSGGIEAVARAMTLHADNDGVQGDAVWAIAKVVGDIPAHIATAKAAGVVPLLQRAKGQGNEDAAKQLKRMGV